MEPLVQLLLLALKRDFDSGLVNPMIYLWKKVDDTRSFHITINGMADQTLSKMSFIKKDFFWILKEKMMRA